MRRSMKFAVVGAAMAIGLAPHVMMAQQQSSVGAEIANKLFAVQLTGQDLTVAAEALKQSPGILERALIAKLQQQIDAQLKKENEAKAAAAAPAKK